MSLRYQIGYVLWVVVLIPVLIEGIEFFGFSKKYSVVIDASYSTTNILISVAREKSGGFKLAEEEVYKKFSPGLSEYIDKSPHQIKGFLKEILNVAEAVVPKGKWSNTPIMFRATAWFRLLSAVQQSQILNEVRSVLLSSPFETGFSYIAEMSNSDEALYACVATNLILDRLHGNPRDMVATVGLDEASSHFTFPLTPEYFQQFAFLDRWVTVADRRVSFYTNSIERLGLGEATVAILQMNQVGDGNHTNSPCVSYIDNGKAYHYNGNEYVIERKEIYDDTNSGFPFCLDKIYNYVDLVGPRKINALLKFQIYAINGFFDVLRDAGVVDSTGGIITGDDIYNTGFKVCNHRIATKYNPFLCLHISYIYGILIHGYRIPASSDIHVSNKENGHHITWATGLAYSNLEFRRGRNY